MSMDTGKTRIQRMSRRGMLSCAGAAALVAARPAAALDVSSLEAEIDPVSLRALAGTRIRAAGFALPHVRGAGGFFVLSASASSVCPHCQAAGGAAASDLFVYPRGRPAVGRGVWEGTLDVGGLVDPDTRTFSFVRLYDAERVTD
jgi:hypothetical protein